MENEKIYNMPYVGCMMGSAFQRLITQLEAALKRDGIKITSAEYMILRALYSHDGLQQCEIVDMVGKDKSSVCRCVATLAKKELVRTETVSYKCTRAWLTEKARDIQPKIMQIASERHQALAGVAPKKDLEAFERVLKAILDNG